MNSKRRERSAEVARLTKTPNCPLLRSEERIRLTQLSKVLVRSNLALAVVTGARERRHLVWLTQCKEPLIDVHQLSSLVAQLELAIRQETLAIAHQVVILHSRDQSSL